jgi:hypothetical protein
MSGFRTLLYKEILRFWKVLVQTVGAPVLTALLYLLIFSHVLEEHVQVYPGVSYTAFLMPGLIMMSVLQNAFANSSSSLIQSKITGNIVFVLLPPLSYLEFFLAYLIAALVRGFTVGLGVLLVGLFFADISKCAIPSGYWPSPSPPARCSPASASWPASGPTNTTTWPPCRTSSSCRSPSCPACSIPSIPCPLLAGRVPLQSGVLHDRRFPLRFLRPGRRGSLAEPGRGGAFRRAAIRPDFDDVEVGL